MNKKRYIIFTIVALVLGGLIFYFVYGNSSDDTQTTQNNQTESPAQEPEQEIEYTNINSKLLVAGDIFWGRHIELLAEQSNDPVNHPFRGLNTLEREKYDTWIANVECPITNNVVGYQTQIDTLIFNCPPKFIEGFKQYFDVVSLANNHTDNQGLDGLVETRKHLDDANLQHFGHYDNSVTEDLCDVTVINAKQDGKETQFPIVMCGFHGVFNTPTQDQIAEISKYSDHFITIAMPHSGAEYKATADDLKIETYRAMADAGADIVIGGHPHWVQDSESYDDKLILYSLGNFIFDQNFNPDVSRGVAVDIELSIAGQSDNNAWIELASSCKSFNDECLDKAKELNLTKPDFSTEFDLIGVESNGYLTTKADEATYNALLERTKWQQTMSNLNN